jgi:hypothetical protein
MENKEAGAVEWGAVLLLFFVAVLLSGGVAVSIARGGYLRRNSAVFTEKTIAEDLLATIVTRLQPLREYPADDENNPLITDLCREYVVFDLHITDISSGYHLDFMPDHDLADPALAALLFRSGNATAFIAARQLRGLSTSIVPWRDYLNDAAVPYCVAYGWLPLTHLDSFAFREISRSFGLSDPDMLYPLINDFPLMNINIVDPVSLLPLVTRVSFAIPDAEIKGTVLQNRLAAGPLLPSDISTILGIPVDHPIFTYLGTKTTFWQIAFHRDAYYVTGIVAAIPEKHGNWQAVASYELIDRSISYVP